MANPKETKNKVTEPAMVVSRQKRRREILREINEEEEPEPVDVIKLG